MRIERVEGAVRAFLGRGAGQHGPALRDRVDAAFGIAGRAERRAVVEVGAAVPVAVPGVLLEVRAQGLGFALAAVRERGVAARACQRREVAQHAVEEEAQPHALAAPTHADVVHAVVPVAGADQRQSVRTHGEAVLDRAHAVEIERRRAFPAERQIVVRLLARAERAAVQERLGLVQHRRVAGARDVAAGGERQPQEIVRAARAHAAAGRRMPPVLDVALLELARRAKQQLRAHELRRGVRKRHRVLQLVAESERAARLVVPAPAPEPATDHLVQQPAVGERVQRLVRRLDLERAEQAPPLLPHRTERRVRRAGLAERAHERAGFVRVGRGAEAEDDLPRLPVLELERDLDRGAGIHQRAHATRQMHALERRGPRQVAVAADELEAIPGQRALGLVHVEERDPLAELGVEGIAREQGAAARIELGDHVHRRLRREVAQHPFDVARHRKRAAAARRVSKPQHDELHRLVGRDVDALLAFDAVLGVLEDAVAEAMAAAVLASPSRRQRRGRPVASALVVADIEGLSRGIADRIVVPGREAILVRVLAPGVAHAAFGHDAAEVRIRDDVDPGRRGRLAGTAHDDVLAPVRREAAQPVVERDPARR